MLKKARMAVSIDTAILVLASFLPHQIFLFVLDIDAVTGTGNLLSGNAK